MNKKVAFPPKPSLVVSANADAWVSGTPTESEDHTQITTARVGKMKRFTFDVPENLHRRIKTRCAEKGVDMADEMRRLLEEHFPQS